MKLARLVTPLCVLVIFALGGTASRAQAQQTESWPWYSVDENKTLHLNLYLFWSRTCPHCLKAQEFIRYMQGQHPWLRVYSYEITTNPSNVDLYRQMAASLNRQAGQVPAFFYCRRLDIGYDSWERNGQRLEANMVRCYEALKRQQERKPNPEPNDAGVLHPVDMQDGEPADQPKDEDPFSFPEEPAPNEYTVHVPLVGDVNAQKLSLPVMTLIIAGCDSVNPCAFFVLLLLLSLMIHAQNRLRMLIVGGIFVFFSGFVYFLFMSAWLNLFFIVGQLRWITLAAGIFAIGAAFINIKDYFWFKQGVSLSIPESAKPSIYQRMSNVVRQKSLLAMAGGTIVLAATTNLYELLCTSGFPMIFTRLLTLQGLSTAGSYLYLILYNIIYVVPLALIVLAFTATLGARKLSEQEGRILKLLSGTMMLVLGLMLVFSPGMLNSVAAAVATLFIAIGVTAGIVVVDRLRTKGYFRSRHDSGTPVA